MNKKRWLYTPYYCEENIWYLGQQPEFKDILKRAVFISNDQHQCRLSHQRAAILPGFPVIWDYHVVLISHVDRWYVWDLDTTLPVPTLLLEYLDLTFEEESKDDKFRPYFRVVDFEEFRSKFSSDRSHMRDSGGNWIAPPPDWPPILMSEPSNLSTFIDMSKGAFGCVLDFSNFKSRYGV